MFLIIYLGKQMFNLQYSTSTQAEDANETYTAPCGLELPTVNGIEAMNKKMHNTIIFNTFVFLQWFNQINCRTVEARDFNVFRRFWANGMFVAVLILIFFVQWSASNWLFFIFETT
mmetsp:Transcript_41559/g.29941  ORF Transcript_41559/g.29941 Transcript_41559/m.29941 type:complete len:116 (+) Transcript_41559:2897-3244(+)